ncbi:Epoxide hydrolase protein [Rutstroemia sp. NJR-2017a BVV2]|nr:Epoxide hydrolase protein [Rutstroemia sp. NJR-2017a BVV2]
MKLRFNKGEMAMEMDTVRPFKIDIPDASLERLHKKLELADFPEEPEAGPDYGATVSDVKRLAAYWKDGFDWKKQEAKLNELPHFKTMVEVDGFGELDMHFLHQKSNVPGAIPLLLWNSGPGSFLEVTHLLPLLKDSVDGPSFHRVYRKEDSEPGDIRYCGAFSPKLWLQLRHVKGTYLTHPLVLLKGEPTNTSKKGFAIPHYAASLHKIMLALGYNEYVTQGGDWGFFITRALAHLYPTHVKALHTNWPYAPFPSIKSSPLLAAVSMIKHGLGFYTTREASDIARAKETAKGQETGYLPLLSTKPLTLSFSLNDSPVGLLAFIYEKLACWTDVYEWTDDEILTWISIYYFSTAGPGAAAYIYKEARDDKVWPLRRFQNWVRQPLGFRYFPRELASLPKGWLAGMGTVVLVGESEKGGHFGAWEFPEDIVEDLKKMFGKGGGAFGLVEGKSGY